MSFSGILVEIIYRSCMLVPGSFCQRNVPEFSWYVHIDIAYMLLCDITDIGDADHFMFMNLSCDVRRPRPGVRKQESFSVNNDRSTEHLQTLFGARDGEKSLALSSVQSGGETAHT